jgi:hypothetical protein
MSKRRLSDFFRESNFSHPTRRRELSYSGFSEVGCGLLQRRMLERLSERPAIRPIFEAVPTEYKFRVACYGLKFLYHQVTRYRTGIQPHWTEMRRGSECFSTTPRAGIQERI